jgi:hypothetical protein
MARLLCSVAAAACSKHSLAPKLAPEALTPAAQCCRARGSLSHPKAGDISLFFFSRQRKLVAGLLLTALAGPDATAGTEQLQLAVNATSDYL